MTPQGRVSGGRPIVHFKHTVRRATDLLGSAFVPGADLPVVIADRDEHVHEVAKKTLQGLEVAGSPVAVREAWSAEEARTSLDGAGLVLVEAELAPDVLAELREERADSLARVLVRVDADLPFDEAAVERFSIDGFLDRDDFEIPLRLYVAVRTALRAHAHAKALDKQVEGLDAIAESLSNVQSRGVLAGLLAPLLEDVARNCWTSDWLCVPFLDELERPDAIVLASGTLTAKDLPEIRAKADATPGTLVQLPSGRVAFKFLDPKTRATMGLLVVASAGPVPPRVRAMAQSVGAKLSIARQNIELSQRLQAEKEAAQEIYNDRMGMLGRLAAGVAHELNTPLGIAVHACSLMKELEGEDRNEAVALIEKNVHAAADLVKSFKSMAVDQASDQTETFDPARIVADALASLAHVLKPKGQTLRHEPEGEAIQLTNNPGALSQVVNNLVLNASKHGYKDGPGEIVIRHRSLSDRFELEIRDQGGGMDEKTARRIFEPFHTTAKDRGGSGLGMSIVHQIVTRTYGGTIAVESEPGKGARFVVTLPVRA